MVPLRSSTFVSFPEGSRFYSRGGLRQRVAGCFAPRHHPSPCVEDRYTFVRSLRSFVTKDSQGSVESFGAVEALAAVAVPSPHADAPLWLLFSLQSWQSCLPTGPKTSGLARCCTFASRGMTRCDRFCSEIECFQRQLLLCASRSSA